MSLSSDDRLFQIVGAETENWRLPSVVRVRIVRLQQMLDDDDEDGDINRAVCLLNSLIYIKAMNVTHNIGVTIQQRG